VITGHCTILEEVIRGFFLLIVIILQSRDTNTARVTRSM